MAGGQSSTSQGRGNLLEVIRGEVWIVGGEKWECCICSKNLKKQTKKHTTEFDFLETWTGDLEVEATQFPGS